MTVGERIYYCRTENHMTQKELGEKTGIDPSTIRKYESGRLNPKISTLQKIADALEVDVNWLLNGFTLEDHDNAFIRWLRHEPAEPDLEYSHMVAQEQENERNWYIHQQELLDSINESFSRLNDAGQEEATKRVKELTLLPQYQCATDVPQDAPAGPDDKTPAEK